MPGALRYSDPELCDQLAARYVTGHMTVATRRRLEQLIVREPMLRQAVACWADRMVTLQDTLPDHEPPADLWLGIRNRLLPDKGKRYPVNAAFAGLWKSLTVWRLTTLTACVTTLILALLVLSKPDRGPLAASYIAPLSEDGEVGLLVSGYRESPDGQFSLLAQWSRTQDSPTHKTPYYLWAEDRQSHHLVFLGSFSVKNTYWTISTAKWQAVANSGRLLVSRSPDRPDATTTFEYTGPCLQLSPWTDDN